MPAPRRAGPPDHLYGMDDPAGEPYKEAARVLLRAVIAGDGAAARAAFAGTGDDLVLLECALEANRAAGRLRGAVAHKFGPLGDQAVYFDLSERALRSVDHQTVIVGIRGDPDTASISPGGFPSDGYELRRKGGRWLVRSLTVFPEDMPRILAAYRDIAARYDSAAKGVAAGDFRDAEQVRRSLPGMIYYDRLAHPSLWQPTSRPSRVRGQPA